MKEYEIEENQRARGELRPGRSFTDDDVHAGLQRAAYQTSRQSTTRYSQQPDHEMPQ